MSLKIIQKDLNTNKEKVVGITNIVDMDIDLNKILESLEDDGYIQCECSDEESNQWDMMYEDWVVVCDCEFDDDRMLIYVTEA